MKKILAALSACTVFAVLLAAVGCSGGETFDAKRYSSVEDSVKSVTIDVTDREVEIITSADGQVHIDYSESEQEFYSIRLSEDGDLTMTLETNKDWTDFIGTKPAAQYRKITLAVPSGLKRLSATVPTSPLYEWYFPFLRVLPRIPSIFISRRTFLWLIFMPFSCNAYAIRLYPYLCPFFSKTSMIACLSAESLSVFPALT